MTDFASPPGMSDRPLRVAIIGAGPSAFYAADALLKHEGLVVEIDMFDRLPTPFGLVRAGVAPDHQKIKTVTKGFTTVASDPRFRFYGNVEVGRDIALDDLREYYDQILFATGAQSDKRMGIPGEDLAGSFPATSFVAWYNGHPDFREMEFDLDQESAVIVGVGNVAIDVARILCLSPEELRASDMADYAVEALSKSRIREVHLLGRRGPAQAAFTTPELKELGELAEADVFVKPEEAALDALSQHALDTSGDRALARKVEMIQAYSTRTPAGHPRKLFLRFLIGPVELVADGSGHVSSVRCVRNKLSASPSGSIVAEASEVFEEINAGLVFRSVGYRGSPIAGLPFHERWGVILNHSGRVVSQETQEPLPGLYVTGWIKRGPNGVIGTNKPDSVETVGCMIEDFQAGKTLRPAHASRAEADAFVRSRTARSCSFDDWLKLDALELAAGAACGRPRVKFTSVGEMLAALGR